MPTAAVSIPTASPDRVALVVRNRARNTAVRGPQHPNHLEAASRVDVPVALAPVAIAARGAAVAAVSGAAIAEPTGGHGRGTHPVPDKGTGC